MPTPITSSASTVWLGDLASGSGRTEPASGAFGPVDVSWKSRTGETGGQTTPEELIASAHASCYSMALSHELAGKGTPPARVETSAAVDFVAGEGIKGIALTVEAEVPGISEEDFLAVAEAAKTGCPVSAALSAVPITLSATLR